MSEALVQAIAAPSDRCPRCGDGFHCGVNDDAPCACTTITLAAAMQAALRSRYQGCLCLSCLRCLSCLQTPSDAALRPPISPAIHPPISPLTRPPTRPT